MATSYIRSGTEFRINTRAFGSQEYSSIATRNGGFVAVWQTSDSSQDGSQSAIKGQLVATNGQLVGAEFLVNSAGSGAQSLPRVTTLADGKFVVTWQTRDGLQDGSYDSVKAQIFAADGTKFGNEFLVNSQTANIQWQPAISSLSNGNFAVVWETYDSAQDGSGRAIKAQIFSSSGARIGSEFLVNSVTSGNQVGPDVTSLADGRFLVSWASAPVTSEFDIRGQIFSASGAKIGGEISVNATTAPSEVNVRSVGLPNGGFVTTWQTFDTTQDGSGSAIKAQIFDANGARVGGEFVVNSYGANNQYEPSVAVLANGDFVVGWHSYLLADGGRAQIFTAGGVRIGTEINLGANWTDLTLAAGADGGFIVAGTVSDPVTFDYDIKAQLFISKSPPEIRSNGGGETAAVTVVENTTLVTTVNAIDLNGPLPVRYSIAGGTDAARFVIDTVTGILSFVAAPDVEAPNDSNGDNIYGVIVTASDGEAADTQALTVTVQGTNEAPQISSAPGASIAEGTLAVTTIQATDPEHDVLNYSIVGGADATRFMIDSATGALRFVVAPDFEAPADSNGDNVYNVTIRASDGTLFDTQALSISVTNVNEGVSISTGTGRIFITENSTAVTMVRAVDVDGDAVTYSVTGGADAAKFVIDAQSGTLSFVAAPDFEAPADSNGDNIYDVIVSATDGAFVDSKALSVAVTNVNEGVSIVAGAGVSTVIENGTAVTVIRAVDIDGDVIAYSIVGGADAARFAIDPTTGALSFVAAPDYEAPSDSNGDNVYDVAVGVSDGQFDAVAALSVAVTNTNDVAPAIISNGGGDAATVVVDENSVAIATIAATDLDSTNLAYAIAGGADAASFMIDAASGALVFSAAPDFERPTDANNDHVYEVLVSASDGLLIDLQALRVEVTNVNDTAPVIGSNGGGATATVSINENTEQATIVAATDADGPAPSYAIVGGSDAARFTIDATTGALRFVVTPDFEAPGDTNGDNVYNVTVAAQDGAFSTTQALSVTVANVNDVAPVIASPAAVSIAENAIAVTTVVATDADGPVLAYAIAGGADAARFTIDAATGILRFATAPDYENPGDTGRDNVYDVVVGASDGLYTDTQALAISVSNTNDLAPIFGDPLARFPIRENTTAIWTFAATDADGPAPTYAISGTDASFFAINAVTGQLTFGSAPDFETPLDAGRDNEYNLTVSATDGVHTTSLAVTVEVFNDFEGATITGTKAANTISTTVTVTGQPLATALDDLIYAGAGNDIVNSGGGADWIYGEDGNDKLNGEGGSDVLIGGRGADQFIFSSTADSAVAATDIIGDFNHAELDRINLSAIDANVLKTSNQAFTFIGDSAFSGVAGQLHYAFVNGNTLVSGDVNGDRIADFGILVSGIVPLVAADFVL